MPDSLVLCSRELSVYAYQACTRCAPYFCSMPPCICCTQAISCPPAPHLSHPAPAPVTGSPSEDWFTRTPKALRFFASPEAARGKALADADAAAAADTDAACNQDQRAGRGERDETGHADEASAWMLSRMLSSLTQLAEATETLLCCCQERARTQMAAWEQAGQEREEEGMARMLEREEWSQQSQAYLRRIAEMEREGEECVGHLEGEIDRLLNKVSNDMCVCAYVHARVCVHLRSFEFGYVLCVCTFLRLVDD